MAEERYNIYVVIEHEYIDNGEEVWDSFDEEKVGDVATYEKAKELVGAFESLVANNDGTRYFLIELVTEMQEGIAFHDCVAVRVAPGEVADEVIDNHGRNYYADNGVYDEEENCLNVDHALGEMVVSWTAKEISAEEYDVLATHLPGSL